MFGILLKYKFLSWENSVLRAKNRAATIIPLVAFLTIPYFFTQNTYAMFSAWLAIPQIPDVAIFQYMKMSQFILFILLTVSGLPLAFHHFFLSEKLNNMAFLPISQRTFFSFKLFEFWLANLPILLLLGIPHLVGFALTAKLSITAVIIFSASILMLYSLACFLSAFICFLVTILTSPKNGRAVTSVLFLILMIGGWLTVQAVRASQLDPNSSNFNPAGFSQLAEKSALPILDFLPSIWLVDIAQHLFANNLSIIYPFLSLFFSMLLLCAVLYPLYIFLGQKQFQDTDIKIKHTAQLSTSPLLVELIKRDFKIMFRDQRHVTQTLFLMSTVIILPLFVEKPFQPADLMSTLFPISLITLSSGFAVATLASRLVALEGRAFALTHTTPVSPLKIIVGKVSSSLILIVPITIISTLLTMIRFELFSQAFWVMIYPLLCMITISTMGVWGGLKFSNFDWDSPQKMIKLNGQLFLTIAVLVLGLFASTMLTMGLAAHKTLIVFLIYVFILGLMTTVGTFQTIKKLKSCDWSIHD